MPLVGHWLATKMLLVGAPVSVDLHQGCLGGNPPKRLKKTDTLW